MGTKYRTIQVDIPANGEAVDTLLSVPTGATYKVAAVGRSSAATMTMVVRLGDTTIVEIPHDMSIGWGNFIPLNLELKGPTILKVGAVDYSGSGSTQTYAIAYED